MPFKIKKGKSPFNVSTVFMVTLLRSRLLYKYLLWPVCQDQANAGMVLKIA